MSHVDTTKILNWIANRLVLLPQLLQEMKRMSEALNSLAEQVARVETVNQSAVALLQGLHVALVDALAKQTSGEDPAAVQALAERLAADTDALAAAVAANTVAEADDMPELPAA
jgi:hypothetical protein